MINRFMANSPNLLKRLLNELQYQRSRSTGLIDIELVKGFVSSPRLADFYVRGPQGPDVKYEYIHTPRLADFEIRSHNGTPLVEVGDSFLSAKTMLADNPQKTYGVPIQIWDDFKEGKELVDDPDIWDMNVARIQLWPFDPSELSLEQLTLAVAISYSPRDWMMQERVAAAVDDLIKPLGFFVDWDKL